MRAAALGIEYLKRSTFTTNTGGSRKKHAEQKQASRGRLRDADFAFHFPRAACLADLTFPFRVPANLLASSNDWKFKDMPRPSSRNSVIETCSCLFFPPGQPALCQHCGCFHFSTLQFGARGSLSFSLALLPLLLLAVVYVPGTLLLTTLIARLGGLGVIFRRDYSPLDVCINGMGRACYSRGVDSPACRAATHSISSD